MVKLIKVDDMTGEVLNTCICQNDDQAWDFINEEYKHDEFWIFA